MELFLYCAPEVYPDYGNYAMGLQPKRRRSGDPSPKPSPYDESVDMWSFAAVIFHLLAGKAPIAGQGDDRGVHMLSNIMTKDIDFTPLRAQSVSDDGIDFIAQLLNRNPHKRPKAPECLRHAWLQHVPDSLEYLDEGPSPDVVRRALERLEEVDEENLDIDMIHELEQLTQPPVKPAVADSQSPARPTKKLRKNNESDDLPRDIIYPTLPAQEVSSSPAAAATVALGRLFGEISSSALRSSGLFGDQLPPTTVASIPELRHGVEQISVNDFQSMEDESSPAADVSGQPLEYPQSLKVPRDDPPGSAPSLLGAEAQIGQLNVASPEDGGSAATTPETTNPVTPRTRELSPSSSISKSADSEHAASQQSRLGEFTRTVDLNLINDEAAYAAEIAAREASRAEIAAREAARAEIKPKAETFQVLSQPRQAPSIEFARTIDAGTGQEVRREPLTERNENLQQRLIAINPPISTDDVARPPRQFGKLTSTSDSYTCINIPLERYDTFWGRDRACNVRYPDALDTRIPKWALKVWFWSEGLDGFVKSGGDWTSYPGIYTIIATSATNGILVNGMKLSQTSEDKKAGLYGRLYRGDVVTIYQQNEDANVLKFDVDILFGQGARSRPESEKPFVILKEEKKSPAYLKQIGTRQSRALIKQDASSRSSSCKKMEEESNQALSEAPVGPSIPQLEGEDGTRL